MNASVAVANTSMLDVNSTSNGNYFIDSELGDLAGLIADNATPANGSLANSSLPLEDFTAPNNTNILRLNVTNTASDPTDTNDFNATHTLQANLTLVQINSTMLTNYSSTFNGSTVQSSMSDSDLIALADGFANTSSDHITSSTNHWTNSTEHATTIASEFNIAPPNVNIAEGQSRLYFMYIITTTIKSDPLDIPTLPALRMIEVQPVTHNLDSSLFKTE